jgi:Ca-activated chloride channel family protein
MMEFEEKSYFYLLLAIPVLVMLFVYVLYWKRKKQALFASSAMLNQLSPERSLFKTILSFSLQIIGLGCLVIGLVNPKMGTKMETVKREGIDIVFALDVSKSMLAEDVAPSRLEKGKQVISQIINQLGNDRIGIIAYSGSAFPVLPITTDYGIAKMYLQTMNPGMVSAQGTSLKSAFELAATFFDKKDKTNKLLILISDGEDHEEGAEAAAEEANKMGLKILTIGVGSEKGGPIPIRRNGIVDHFQRDQNDEVVITRRVVESLKGIAQHTKGRFVDGNNTKNVVEFVKNALDHIEKTEFESTQMANFKSQYQWFLAFGFLLLFAESFMWERKTRWIQKLNLFNEKTS